MYARNRHHTSIQEKLAALGMCVEVRLVAEALLEEHALNLERQRISFWRSVGVGLANLTDGGEQVGGLSEETRSLMRDAKIGRKLTKEHKEKIGKKSRASQIDPKVRALRGQKIRETARTPEYKEKQSKSQSARVRTKEHYEKVSKALTGRKLSPEHAEKARIASLGRTQKPEEIEQRREANKGRTRSVDSKAKMSASWTSERRMAQSIRTTEMNLSKKATKNEGAV